MHRKTSLWRKGLRLAAPFAAAVLVLAFPLVAGAQEGPPGNNGTVKVDGLPFDHHPDNESHPGCRFEIDGYNFDANATSDVTFETQNPTGVSLLLEDTVTSTGIRTKAETRTAWTATGSTPSTSPRTTSTTRSRATT